MFKTWIKIWPEFQVETAAQRRRFVFRTFITLACFVLIAVAQWVPLVCYPDVLSVVQRHESTFVVTFLMSMFLLSVYLISDQVRYTYCLSWVLVLVVVECEIVSLLLLEVETNVLYLMLGLLVSLLVMVFGVGLGFLLPHDLTKSMNFMFTVSFSTLVVSVYVAVFLGILRLTWPFFVYAGIIVLMLLPVVVYHTQYTLGVGEMRMSLQDDKLAALLLFTDFLALFMLTLYLRPNRSY
ncbi:hypothetical protein KR093_006276 [Drosophila rubida]|uniref:Uncharacterized protein n=1 Tax=Drosophila rubida TaxID=30044 RepID=A0AAD4K261_9MUSC|nr:hypothetical protein KR093_006276 [Drosophila rubida]